MAAAAALAAADEAAALAAAAAVDETIPGLGIRNGNADAALGPNSVFKPVALGGVAVFIADEIFAFGIKLLGNVVDRTSPGCIGPLDGVFSSFDGSKTGSLPCSFKGGIELKSTIGCFGAFTSGFDGVLKSSGASPFSLFDPGFELWLIRFFLSWSIDGYVDGLGTIEGPDKSFIPDALSLFPELLFLWISSNM